MSTTFGITLNNEFVPVARRHNIGNGKVEITIINPLVLMIHKDTPLDNDNSPQGISNVRDLHIALSKQYINEKSTDILRENVITNKLD